MIKHIWSVLCRESIIDADTNNISLNQIYENLQFNTQVNELEYSKNKKVGGPFNFEIVSLFFRDKKGAYDEVDIAVEVLDPSGEKLGDAKAKLEFKEEFNRMRSRIKFDTIALSTSGTYLFQVYVLDKDKKKLVTAIPLDIQLTVNGKLVQPTMGK